MPRHGTHPAQLGLAVLLLLAAGLARAHDTGKLGELPQLSGDRTRVECLDALALARASFFGATFELDMPSTSPPAALHSRFVLDEADFNGVTPETLPPDDSAFERFGVPAKPSREMLWERSEAVPWRWVVMRDTWSWRGDQFALYAVSASTSQEGFLANRADHDDAKPASDDSVKTIFEGYHPPYMLRLDVDQSLWAVVVGESWHTLSGWRVLVRTGQGVASPCSIRFGLEENQSALPLLPSELARLDDLLLGALGPGTDEGELHPTARIHIDARRTWANIALRPWSLPQPYNTRDEVETGLVAWASQSVDQQAQLARIRALVPRTERALAAYYRRVFGVSEQQARHSATHAIDVALRMHFVFHSDRAQASGGGADEPNPWPADVTMRLDGDGSR